MTPRWLAASLIVAVTAAPAATQASEGQKPPEQVAKVDFVRQIWPILSSRCIECHGPEEQEADLRLDSREAVFPTEAGADGVIVPGKPEESPLFERITLPSDDPDLMPADGEPLDKDQIALIKRWIAEGASWPDDVPAAGPVRRDTIELAPLAADARARADAALEKIRQRGALALPVSAGSSAVEVNFSLVGKEVGDTDLALLGGLEPVLVWLHLGRTGVTDAGLERLATFTQLRRLNLSNTTVGDAGLAHLAGASRLEVLNLYGTAVTDAGLQHLKGCSSLRKVFLWGSRVTAEGARALAAALPGAKVDRGEDAARLRAMATLARPVNEKCPLTGKPVNAAQVFTHDGRTIGFCCPRCLASFAADPAKHLPKVDAALSAEKSARTEADKAEAAKTRKAKKDGKSDGR